MALAVSFDGGIRREEVPGSARLAGRLLLKGTARRGAEELARELDERAIELQDMISPDCSVLLAVFLNRELEPALHILADVLVNSTFADFDKEATKLAGEIRSALDLPSELAQDLLGRALFPDHPYGHTGSRMLEGIAALDRECVQGWHAAGLDAARMNVALVGEFIPEGALPLLERAFGGLPRRDAAPVLPPVTPVAADRRVTQAKVEAHQAQIYQAWYAPALGTPEQAAMSVMNTILGAPGLSSRLFRELRDKQGLAYSVSSRYIALRQAGELVASIGTSPENIEQALRGFAEQVARMQDEPASEDELASAINRLRGQFVLSHETTAQRCLDLTVAHINGLPPDFSERQLARIAAVDLAAAQAAARRIHAPSVTAIVAREEFLAGAR